MRVAVFTDADFDRADGVTTALGALLRHAPPDVRPRIYTLSDLDVDEPEYLALRSPAMPFPRADTPRCTFLACGSSSGGWPSTTSRAIHMTTPGPAGLAARALAHRTGLPLVGSLPSSAVADAVGGTDGWRHRSAVVPHYLRWLYGACRKVLVPSADVARRLTDAGWNEHRLIVWPGAVDADAFSPARRSQRLRNAWHVSERRPAILCVGTLSRGSGMDSLSPSVRFCTAGIAHRFIVVGEGPALAEFAGGLS